MDNPNSSGHDCAADDESDKESNYRIEDLECPEEQDESVAPNVSGLVWPTQKSNRQAEQVLVTVSAVDMGRNKGAKIRQDRMHQWFTSFM